MKSILQILTLILLFPQAHCLAQSTILVNTGDGGNVITAQGGSITINEGSTMRRSFIVINDTACPIQLGNTGVVTTPATQERGYLYRSAGSLSSSKSIRAFEIRYVLYDVFGEYIKTLGGIQITDLPPGPFINSYGVWHAYGRDVSRLFTVVAFVARTRSDTGEIWQFDQKAILNAIAQAQMRTAGPILEPTKDLENPPY